MGANAGKAVARLSGRQLADMTDRPLRTVRYALNRLTKAAVISRVDAAAGRKAVYVINLGSDA
jgi:hypothetical protein